MMFRDMLSLTVLTAICFFLLSGAGIFSLWFWLMVFT